jgi:NAD(P)H-hydrate epimerase
MIVKQSTFLRDRKIREFLKKRRPDSHKGDHGRVLVIGGSKWYSGAPALAAMAALRTGADIVTVLAPSSVANVIRGYSPNIIVHSYEGGYLHEAALHEFERTYKHFDSFIIGSGMGSAPESAYTLHEIIRLLKKGRKKFVIDADAFKFVTPKQLAGASCVVTPHAKEYELFADKQKPEKLAKDFCILLKGHVDRIYFGRKKAGNRTGNPGMTVGGTGDTLAGILGALLANTDDLFIAACGAAYLNGRAGDLAYKKLGYSLLATDIIDEIPAAKK